MNPSREVEVYKTFCQDHGISVDEVRVVIDRFCAIVPNSLVDFDFGKYAAFGVLKVDFVAKGITMLPMLFGTSSNLSRLAQFLWEASSNTWSDEMGDLTNRGTYLKRRVLIPAIVNAVRSHYVAGARILDAGCGEGVLTRELIREFPDVYGFDFVAPFIERLKGDFPTIAERFWTADLVNSAPSDSFDIVIASALLLVLPDVDRGLERLMGLVAPRGVLIIADVCSRLHRSLGYYKGNTLVQVHDVARIHHFEKDVGGGGTTAIHNHHPPGYYRQRLEGLGATCVFDKELLASRDDIISDPSLAPAEKELVLQRMAPDLVNPTFFLLIMSKNAVE